MLSVKSVGRKWLWPFVPRSHHVTFKMAIKDSWFPIRYTVKSGCPQFRPVKAPWTSESMFIIKHLLNFKTLWNTNNKIQSILETWSKLKYSWRLLFLKAWKYLTSCLMEDRAWLNWAYLCSSRRVREPDTSSPSHPNSSEPLVLKWKIMKVWRHEHPSCTILLDVQIILQDLESIKWD